MLVFRNLLIAVATVLEYVLVFFMFITIARAVLSWVSPDPYNPIVRFIHLRIFLVDSLEGWADSLR
jgi:YggT family protein